VLSEDEYREEFSYLAEYADDDWLGFSVITGTAATLLGKGYSLEQEERLVLRIVGDLLDLGAQAGDLSDDPDGPFKPWHTGKNESLTRIETELKSLGRSPESGDICWITRD
jgi:hypothetical protein